MNYALYFDGHPVERFEAETQAEAEQYRKAYAEIRGIAFYSLMMKEIK